MRLSSKCKIKDTKTTTSSLGICSQNKNKKQKEKRDNLFANLLNNLFASWKAQQQQQQNTKEHNYIDISSFVFCG